MSALRRGIVVPRSAQWCWDEYLRLSPEQRRLLDRVEREELRRQEERAR